MFIFIVIVGCLKDKKEVSVSEDISIHDPTHIVSWGQSLMVWGSGQASVGAGQCPVVGYTYKNSWERNDNIFVRTDARCLDGGDDWPQWLVDETDGGGDFDAPGVFFDSSGGIPNANGEAKQHLALYYSRYFNGTDTSGQACIGRVSAHLPDGGVLPNDLIWEDDQHPVLCSNTRSRYEENGQSIADPSAGTAYNTEAEWSAETNEALGLDAEIFKGAGTDIYMIYGSHAPGMIKIVQLDEATGRLKTEAQPGWTAEHDATLYPTVATGPMYEINNDGVREDLDEALIEAAFVYPHDGKYYLFVNWFRCCNKDDSTYQIVVGRSDQPMGPYVDKNGQSMAEYYPEQNEYGKPANTPGGEIFLNADMLGKDTHRGPGHPGVSLMGDVLVFSFHYYSVEESTQGDGAKLGLREIRFEDGWPVLVAPKTAWNPSQR